MTGLDCRVVVPEREVDVAFTVPAGQTLALLGANGTGKSTVLAALRESGQTVMLVAVDGAFGGFLGVADPIKTTAAEAVRRALFAVGEVEVDHPVAGLTRLPVERA